MTTSTAPHAPEKTAAPRTCAGCGQPFDPAAEGDTEVSAGDPQTRCPACREQRVLYAVCGVALLFFCFVVLPLMIQLLVTPRPDR